MELEVWCVQLLQVLAAVLGAAAAVWGGYYLLVGAASFRPAPVYPPCPPRHRFAVLIAARNEEAVIAQLVESLLEQRYPRWLYDVYVLPNNCIDATEAAARRAGARILTCTAPVRSKGEVLRFAAGRLLGEGYDAFCVFDADNVVHPDFLAEMNRALCAGALAGQGYRDSKNPHDTAISGCYSIYYWMMDRFYNQGKAGCGLSAMITGTGFMISARALRELGGWNTSTISEDLEMTVQCALHHIPVAWVPRAVTYDEQPLTFRESVKQRRRWSSGTIQVGRLYAPQVSRRLSGGGTAADTLATLAIPLYQAVALLSAVLSALSAGFGAPGGGFDPAVCAGALGVNLLLTAALSTAGAVAVCALEGRLEAKLWKGILLYGVFLLSWVPITLWCFVRGTTQWEPIRHTRVMDRMPAGKALRKSQIA